MNPLLNQPFDTPFQTPPFSKINIEHFKPAIEQAIQDAKDEVNHIVLNKDTPTFYNTVEALALSGEKLERITSIFFNLNSAETSDAMQQIAQEVSPLLSEFGNDIILNKDLYEKVAYVYNHADRLRLSNEQNTLLDKTYKNFVRNGASLSDEQKKKLREIDKKLSKLSLTFGQNVLAETNAYKLHIETEETLKGLPDYALIMARKEAEKNEKDGWIFTLQMPSYLPFMKYAENRALREELYRANGAKAFQKNEYNNEKVIQKIVALRFERAQLLGYTSHADYVLEERMAASPKKVWQFLEDLLEKAKPFAEKDVEQLSIYAKTHDGISELMPWDHAYYAERVKKEKFDLDDQVLKPYFELHQVIEGAFEIARKLYGITFIENREIDTYHNDVKVYEVRDTKTNTTGILYADFFPRKGKRAGAWMTSYRDGSQIDGEVKIPQISIVCNFTEPTQNEPSLLTFQEVTTLFHEFGHALHGLLANTQYAKLAGTNVFWDFVELPSQFMENYCYEREALELFAKHYKTGEVIPQKLVGRIIEAAQFMEGYQTLRQISFGKLDMAWHAVDTREIVDIDAYENEAFDGTQVYPKIDGTNMSTSFSHIFQGGYAAGYYSYKWAEVLDADAFDYFKQKGIFDPLTAKRFHKLLSSGGTVDPMELYREFRGQEPNPDALLKRAGLNKS